MASRFSQTFTLTDIFNNPKLKDKVPLINYRERELENGKISVRTHTKTVMRQILDTTTSAARPFYKPLVITRQADNIVLGGELVGDQDNAVDAIYNALMTQRTMLTWTANNTDMIRDALKESEKNRRNNGLTCKLYLRVQSMQQIEGMSNPQLQALMSDIMENIVYGDDYPATQKKWKVETIAVDSPYNYAQRKEKWKQKVGIV